MGRSPKTIRERLDRAGVVRRQAPRRDLSDAQQAAIVAATLAGASGRDVARRFGVSEHAVGLVLERHDAAGGRVVRRLRSLNVSADHRLSPRRREAVALVVEQRLTQAEAARVMGIAPATVFAHLKAVANRLEHP